MLRMQNLVTVYHTLCAHVGLKIGGRWCQWGDEQEKAFQSLKVKLYDSYVGYCKYRYILGVLFCLKTDANGTYAVCATLGSGVANP